MNADGRPPLGRAFDWLRHFSARVRRSRHSDAYPDNILVSDLGVTLETHVVRGAEIVCIRDNSFAWADVRAIAVFKQDLLTVDRICMQFELADRVVATDEDMTGFDLLTRSVSIRFPDIDHEWRSRVTYPPFAANYEEIWRQGPSAPQPASPPVEAS
jgi:hypothetical protein